MLTQSDCFSMIDTSFNCCDEWVDICKLLARRYRSGFDFDLKVLKQARSEILTEGHARADMQKEMTTMIRWRVTNSCLPHATHTPLLQQYPYSDTFIHSPTNTTASINTIHMRMHTHK